MLIAKLEENIQRQFEECITDSLRREALARITYGEQQDRKLGDLVQFVDVIPGGKKYAAGSGDENQWRKLAEVAKGSNVGFKLSGTHFLTLDFDGIIDNGHIIDAVKPKLEAFLTALHDVTGGASTYTEFSNSKTGLHMLYYLGDNVPGEYNLLTGKFDLVPPDERKKIKGRHSPQIEFFAGQKQIILTGNAITGERCISSGESGLSVFDLVSRWSLQNDTLWDYARARDRPERKDTRIDNARLLDALAAIPSEDTPTWCKVCAALINEGFAFEVFDDWSRKAPNYGGTKELWEQKQKKRARYNGGTIYNLAKMHGYKPGKRAAIKGELEPLHHTDVDQSRVFSSLFEDKALYCNGLDWLVYDKDHWKEDNVRAQGLAQELTDKQLRAAHNKIESAQKELDDFALAHGGDTFDLADYKKNPEVKAILDKQDEAVAFKKYVLRRRQSSKIAATLQEARPGLAVDVSELDADPFLLNTPGGTIDLRTGDIRQHNPKDLITKVTAVSLSRQGAEIWEEFLKRFTSDDAELQDYLQLCAGMFLVGEVYSEKIVIASGGGGNGKSTFFNTLGDVMGDYACHLPPEVLLLNSKINKDAELVILRGKRLVVMKENDEGAILDDGTMKRLSSVDPISARGLYKDPITFKPSHTAVLYTNHLPRIRARDTGTWDRFIIIPFLTRFRGMPGEIKNYGKYLFDNCGGAVLAWMCYGAYRFIKQDCNIDKMPEVVLNETNKYREESDWLSEFISECCDISKVAKIGAGELYETYRGYCEKTGEKVLSGKTFKSAMMGAGYRWDHTKIGSFYYGIEKKWGA